MADHERRIGIAATSDAQSIDLLARELVDAERASACRELAAKAMADPNSNVAVVREGEELVALGIMDYSEPEARLLLLAVSPRRQRQGIGRDLLAWFEATAFVAGIRTIAVELSREDSISRRFYRQAGYRKGHIDRVMYFKSLDSIRLQAWSRKPSQHRGTLKLPRPRQ